MTTNTTDHDLVSEYDFSRAMRGSVLPEGPVDLQIDGAVGYRLRSIPSGVALGDYGDVSEALSESLRLVDAGRSPRTIALDWVAADGQTCLVTAGLALDRLARWALRRTSTRAAPRSPSRKLGMRIDVTNVAEALESLD